MSGDPLDLTGLWHGTFGYPAFAGPTTPFVASLIEEEGQIRGTIIEPNHIGFSSDELQAVVAGARVNHSVDFTKTYDGESDAAHSVDYVGRLSSDGSTITGVWSLADMDGTFEMHRDRKLAQEEEADEGVALPFG